MLSLIFFFSFLSQGAEVKATLNLSPTGSFVAQTTKVEGFIMKTPTGVHSDKIVVPINALVTGIELRDRHMKEKHLEVQKYPEAVVTDANGENGKGTAKLSLHGITSPIDGTYEVVGTEAIIKFKIKLSDFKIDKIKYMGVGVQDEALVEARIPLK